jgi:hypothetical protein
VPAKNSTSKSLASAARLYAAEKSEHELQRLLGVRQMEARSKKRGSRTLAAPNTWQTWELELLGKYTDKEVARRTARTRLSIVNKRRRLGISVMPELRPLTAQ